MIEATEQGSYIDRIAAFFGIGKLDYRLTGPDKRRLAYASIAPALVLLGDVVRFLLQAIKGIPYFNSSSVNFPPTQSFWWHLYSVVGGGEQFLLPIAVVLLILFAIYPVNRSQASLALLVTILLLNVSVVGGTYAVMTPLFHSINDPGLFSHWYVAQVSVISRDAGILSAGYAFLAYRGLSGSAMPVRLRRVRRRPVDDQPREL